MILVVILLISFLDVRINNKPYLPKCDDCNIIVIVPTNIRADHLSLYGYERKTSPNLDKFAKNGIVFTNAFSQMSWSLPVVASLFTSKYPFTHGLMGRQVLSPNETTLAEILKLYNYTTVAFTSGGDYRSVYGIDQGFDVFDDDDNSIIFTGSFNRTTNEALEWLKNNKNNKKFFMFLQGYDTHCPFNPPSEYLNLFKREYTGNLNDSLCVRSVGTNPQSNSSNFTITAFYFENMTISPTYSRLVPVNITNKDIEHLISNYDSEIRYVDYLLGNFLDELERFGTLKNTIVIIIGDHGEIIGEHGRVVRVGQVRGALYDEIIHVPLIIKHPLIKKGKSIEGLVETIDIMPTILDFLDIPINYESQGINLVPLINGSKEEMREFVFSGGNFGGNLELFPYYTTNDAIRSKKWKLIFERSANGINNLELYDLENDPNEMINLVWENPELARALKSNLLKWENHVNTVKTLKKITLTDEELRAVREAGYVN